ncbi:MAG: xanthine dehydrogenase family protein molybdopterin-binding subunit, partial [Dehalococcoidia bacterium]
MDQAEEPMMYDSGDYPSAFRQALEKMDYDNIKSLQGKEEAGKYHGIGIATFVKLSGLGPYERARVVIRSAQDVSVYLGIASLGQGHETTMAQICADALGVPIEIIRVFHGNTDAISDGIGTFGGRATVMGGSALYLASQKLKSKILSIASSHLEIAETDLELRGGRVYQRVEGEETPQLGLDEIVDLARRTGQFDPQESGLVEATYFESNKNAYPYGTHVAHITVDPETGKIDILRYVTAHDVGRCINPLLVQGQIIGAIVQGIGGALMEDLVYDENGQLLTTTFMDYLLPTSTDVPPIDSIVLEEAPSPQNPLGVKGVGELGIVGPGAALANA